MLFSKTCPFCKEKVKKSDLRDITTASGQHITSCILCTHYFRVGTKTKSSNERYV